MTCITLNRLAQSNYLAAAEAVQDLLDEYGFTTDQQIDGLLLKHQIAGKLHEMLTGDNADRHYVPDDVNLPYAP
jgi:hypothetical protein